MLIVYIILLICHAEQREASLYKGKEILHFVQDDRWYKLILLIVTYMRNLK